VLLLAVLALLAGRQAAQAEIAVVTTIKPVHSLVAGVMAGVGTPRVLVTGAASPHTYALKPSDAAAIRDADVFVRVSEDLEPFTKRIVTTLPKKTLLLTLARVPGLTLLPIREGGPFEAHGHSHGHTHGHSHGRERSAAGGEIDGHLWLDPANAKTVVDAVAEALAGKAPEHSARFRANAERMKARIDAMDSEIAGQLAPVAGRPFVVFHDAYQYFERRYGVPAAGAMTINPDVPPSARRLDALRTRIRELGAVCVMREPQFDAKVVRALASGIPARLGELDPEGAAVTPGEELYFTVMRNLATSLRTCLGGA
jgi:zinc transport system substrate-binding protein